MPVATLDQAATGEEDERKVLECKKCKAYRYLTTRNEETGDESSRWAECGTGVLRLLVPKAGAAAKSEDEAAPARGRLVMRRSGLSTVAFNIALYSFVTAKVLGTDGPDSRMVQVSTTGDEGPQMWLIKFGKLEPVSQWLKEIAANTEVEKTAEDK